MPDLSLLQQKQTPENYHLPPKNYQWIVYPPKNVSFSPHPVNKIA